MNKILAAGALVSSLWGAQFAHAFPVADATCLNSNCLADGWTVFDNINGRTDIIECYNGSCAANGWSESVTGSGNVYQSQCLGDGCFVSGWNTFEAFTGRLAVRALCTMGVNGRDCMTSGWIMSSPDGGPATVVRCKDDDCAQFGWTISNPYGPWQEAVCKAGGCFVSGWNVYGH